jgi:hypothetical protein
VESSCECGNGSSGSMKCWETIEWLYNSSSAQLLELVHKQSTRLSKGFSVRETADNSYVPGNSATASSRLYAAEARVQSSEDSLGITMPLRPKVLV